MGNLGKESQSGGGVLLGRMAESGLISVDDTTFSPLIKYIRSTCPELFESKTTAVDKFDSKLMSDLEFVFDAFGEQRNATGDLLWPHVFTVTTLTRNVLVKSGETENLKTLTLIALGHDLLEDTDVTIEQIRSRWGDSVAEGIFGLTKKEEDRGDQSGYIRKLMSESEEVWVVKMVDIIANVSNSILAKDRMPQSWRDDFWFPLLRLYQDWYSQIKWEKYPESGKLLIESCNRAISELMAD